MTAGQCLEREPFSKLRDSRFAAQDNVLVSDSMHAFAVNPRLIGCDHTGKKWLGIRLPADALRTFMHTEIVADAMSCTVAEIAMMLP